MPTYNRATLISRSISSVINQKFQDWELIIIDDGSTDNTSDVVHKFVFADHRIKYHYQHNQKISAARNAGLEKATGRYICFLDSDDEFDNNHLEIFYQHLKEKDFPKKLLYTRFRFADNGSSDDYIPKKPVVYPDSSLSQKMQVFLPYSPPVQTICVPGESKETISFDRNLTVTECYDYCVKCANKYEVEFISATTVTLNGHDDNISVPRNNEASIKFNSTQYKDFLTLKRLPFYKEIVSTKAYKVKMQYLQLELAKCYAYQKKFIKASSSFIKGISYNLSYIVSINFMRFCKSFLLNFLR